MEIRTFTKENRSKFIEDNKAFILNTAEYLCNRPLDWLKDHELNIGLIAFNRACESQGDMHTNFLGYAYALIDSALIQYYIKLEESISFIFEIENKTYLEYLSALSDFEVFFENKKRAMEIALLTQELKQHNIIFKDLQKIKFNDKALKNKLLNLVLSICKSDSLTETILQNKSFDLNILSTLTNLEDNIIKKYKKYIIMLLLVFSKDSYIYFKAYLNIRVGGLND
jgi:RNA polymerase sigma factor